MDTPSGPAARRARWHEMFAKSDLTVLYVDGKYNAVAICLSCYADPAGKAWMDICSHGEAVEMEDAERIIEPEKSMEGDDTKCSVVMASKAEANQRRDAPVRVLMKDTLEESLMAPIDYVESVLMEDWLEDYAASKHWNKYCNAVSARCDDEWREGLTENGDKLFLNDKLLVQEQLGKALIDRWHNAQLMHPGSAKIQRDLEWRFESRRESYAILNR